MQRCKEEHPMVDLPRAHTKLSDGIAKNVNQIFPTSTFWTLSHWGQCEDVSILPGRVPLGGFVFSATVFGVALCVRVFWEYTTPRNDFDFLTPM